MSFSVWISWDKPLSGLAYPPPSKTMKSPYFQLGNLPGTYYRVGKLGVDKPMLFSSKKHAEEFAKLIVGATVQEEEDY
jgi:hypothetical protein